MVPFLGHLLENPDHHKFTGVVGDNRVLRRPPPACLFAPNAPWWAVALLGALTAGAVVTTTNPAYTHHELRTREGALHWALTAFLTLSAIESDTDMHHHSHRDFKTRHGATSPLSHNAHHLGVWRFSGFWHFVLCFGPLFWCC